MTSYKVGYLIGSIAKESINRKLANAMIKLAPAELEFHEISFRDLPIYSYDYDADFPEAGKKFKQAIESSDAILIVTPEYNRSIPGGLKNALDWASRPWGSNSFAGMPSAVIGTSPGSIGTALAQRHLRDVLTSLNALQMAAPEAYIQFRSGMVNEAGEIADPATVKFLSNYLSELHGFVARMRSVSPRNA